ncbi:MAG: RNA methyltransferase [Actinobacteria bacterium]|nr:RNA methyltransferase [Actinomycetota bacterium]
MVPVAELVEVTDPTHPLLADFVALVDPATRRQVERRGGYFVVEGVLAIERLLGLPRWSVRSLALLPKVAERLAPALAGCAAPVAVAEADVLREVVGFDIHRGALASVARTAPRPLAELVPSTGLVLVAEGVNDHENLGALYRNAAAFGVAAVLIDPTSADPFYRRSVRVSLGNVLAVPTGALPALPGGLHELHALGVTTVALTPRADVDLRDLDRRALGGGPVAVVVGAEGPGLTGAALAAAHHRVSIPMASGVDSLNVSTAAAVALHHLSG